MSEIEKAEAKDVEAITKSLPSRIFNPKALPYIVALLVGGLLSMGGYALAQGKVDSRVDAGVAPVAAELERHKTEEAARMARLEASVERLEKKGDEQQRLAAVKEERDAARFDVIYGTILSGRRDPRADALAAPAVPDGGR